MRKKIYLAGALFTLAEQEFNSELDYRLILDFDIFLPQRECIGLETPIEIFNKCKSGIDWCDIIVAIADGTDVDSGTSWEIGYAYGTGKPIILIRTDFRQRGDDFGLNCMLSKSAEAIVESCDYDEIVNSVKYTIDDMIERGLL